MCVLVEIDLLHEDDDGYGVDRYDLVPFLDYSKDYYKSRREGPVLSILKELMIQIKKKWAETENHDKRKRLFLLYKIIDKLGNEKRLREYQASFDCDVTSNLKKYEAAYNSILSANKTYISDKLIGEN